MITRVEGGWTYNQNFDAENRLISVTVNSQTTQFVYDGDGNLIKKINPNGDKTLYVGGIYEVDKASGGSVTGTVTYYLAGGAMRVDGTLYYMLKDHLGSASVLTNASGNAVSGADIRYYPFGEARSSTTSMLTDKLFTGQREITGLGIYHYQARFYSPKIGRFLSADTIVPSYANPQSLNRYSYVYNDPLNYADPSGNIPIDCYGDPGYCSTNELPDPYVPPVPDEENEDDDGGGSGEFCDPVLGCENPDTGVFCEQIRCWYDGVTDVSGTLEDPAVYLAGSVACLGTGLCASLGSAALGACARNLACYRVAVALGILNFYPPNNGFASTPLSVTLQQGQIITRYGSNIGQYASPIGTSISARALPLGTNTSAISGFEVIKPIQNVLAGPVQGWFGQMGGGIQYYLGVGGRTINSLIQSGHLRELP